MIKQQINVFLVKYIVFFSKISIIKTGELIMDFKIKNTNLIFNQAFSQVWKIKKYSYESIARPNYGLLYLFSGNITYTFDDGKIELKAGDIIYLPKNSNYVVEFDLKNGAVHDYLINFDVIGEEEFANKDKPTVVLTDRAGTLLDYFKDVVNVYNEKENPFLINSLFYLCLNSLQMAIQYKNSNQDRLMFEKAAKKLTENFEVSVDSISKELHISRSAFQKKFINYFGMSPVEYRTEKRLKKAEILLKTTDLPIKELSDSLGFYDTAYFYKTFKKAFAITPNEYRKAEKPHF